MGRHQSPFFFAGTLRLGELEPPIGASGRVVGCWIGQLEQIGVQGGSGMQKSAVIETTVQGMGYAFVEAVWASAGLLRVTIDRVDGDAITVDDCERVTRQLQYALEVEGLDYKRLEVSSPGVDRLLRLPDDWVRFAGLEVEVTLRTPFQGRKKYRGVLQGPPGDAAQAEPQTYVIVWDDALLAAAAKPGGKKSGGARSASSKSAKSVAKPAVSADTAGDVHELRFSMAEVREVRLVPVLDFRGRKS